MERDEIIKALLEFPPGTLFKIKTIEIYRPDLFIKKWNLNDPDCKCTIIDTE
jgi:hypothetical protein